MHAIKFNWNVSFAIWNLNTILMNILIKIYGNFETYM